MDLLYRLETGLSQSVRLLLGIECSTPVLWQSILHQLGGE